MINQEDYTAPTEFHKDRGFYKEIWHFYYWNVVDMVYANTKVLDLGCGRGALIRYLESHKNCTVKGVDVSLDAKFICESSGVSCELKDINYEVPDDIGSYDYILLTASLEHLIDPKATLNMINSKMKPGAEIIIVVPNFSFIVWRWYYLTGANVKKYWNAGEVKDINGLQPDGHLQFFTPATLNWLLENTGFGVKEWSNTRKFEERKKPPNGIKGLVYNWLLLPVYNAMPLIPVFCPLLVVRAKKIKA